MIKKTLSAETGAFSLPKNGKSENMTRNTTFLEKVTIFNRFDKLRQISPAPTCKMGNKRSTTDNYLLKTKGVKVLQTQSIVIDETIWGEVNRYSMPEPQVYCVEAQRETGFVIPVEEAKKLLTEKALSLAAIHEGIAYFAWYGAGRAARYELLCAALKKCDDALEAQMLQSRINELMESGRVDYPEYFGECPPPSETPFGIVESFMRVANGLYIVRANGTSFLAINEVLAESKLTFVAQYFAERKKEYLFFDEYSSAVALMELYTYFSSEYKTAIESIVKSWDTLYAVLWQNFRSYVVLSQENDEAYTIPVSGAKPGTFWEISCCAAS